MCAGTRSSCRRKKPAGCQRYAVTRPEDVQQPPRMKSDPAAKRKWTQSDTTCHVDLAHCHCHNGRLLCTLIRRTPSPITPPPPTNSPHFVTHCFCRPLRALYAIRVTHADSTMGPLLAPTHSLTTTFGGCMAAARGDTFRRFVCKHPRSVSSLYESTDACHSK